MANETRDGFEVHELGGGQSHVAFDYRIVARRKGYKSIRLADKTQQFTSKTHDERHPSPWVPSGDVHNDVAHDFSALDDLVRLGDALKRQAAGDGVNKPPAFKQLRKFVTASRAVGGREFIDQKESQSNAVDQQPVARQSGLGRRRPVHDDRGVRP